MKQYVVGFMLDHPRENVVLIRKNRPEWQAGRLNGVGGKVEPGETREDAMVREFGEETGMATLAWAWDQICTIAWPDDAVRVGDAEPTTCTFFRAVDVQGCRLEEAVTSTTDELVVVRNIMDVIAHDRIIPNLRWLLPLAAYTADRYGPFRVDATVATIL